MNDHIIPLNYQSSAKNHQIGEESFQYEMPLKVKSKSKKKKKEISKQIKFLQGTEKKLTILSKPCSFSSHFG